MARATFVGKGIPRFASGWNYGFIWFALEMLPDELFLVSIVIGMVFGLIWLLGWIFNSFFGE